jgi:transcriptional regulator with XRE-family HTH domain
MPRQKDLARETGLHQSRISVFETPGAANVTLETLANIAAGLKVGLIVKFVPFSEMLYWESNYSQDTFDVFPRLGQDEAFLDPPAVNAEPGDVGAAGAASTGLGSSDFVAAKKRPAGTVQLMAGNLPAYSYVGAQMANQQEQVGGD